MAMVKGAQCLIVPLKRFVKLVVEGKGRGLRLEKVKKIHQMTNTKLEVREN